MKFKKMPSDPKPFTVLLSGSTGNLGTYMLDILLQNRKVDRIICLNRAPNARHKQTVAISSRGLGTQLDERIEFVQASFPEQNLGIDRNIYEDLARRADVFIHNAWPVDFNRNFSSFKPSIDSVQGVIDFCETADRVKSRASPVQLIFISSASATSNWGSAAPTSRAKIPEAEIKDWKVARTGYGQSKLISERLLSRAAESLDLSVTIIRVTQLGGPVKNGLSSKWPEQEWVACLIRSSLTLGVLPGDLGPASRIDWVPSDMAAQIIAEFAASTSASTFPARKKGAKRPAAFYNLSNPKSSMWQELVPAMLEYMPHVKAVPFVDWVDALRKSIDGEHNFSGVDQGTNPAAKLFEFFEHWQERGMRFPKAIAPELESKKMVQISPVLGSLPAVGPEWMRLWMRQWAWSDASDTSSKESKHSER